MSARFVAALSSGIIILGVISNSPAPVVHAAAIQAGIAQADITPPIGGLTTGYSSAKPTDGVHDPVGVRVLVLKTETTTVAIVSCDLCIVNMPTLFDQTEALGIDHLLVMNTHTHAGPKLAQEDFPSTDKPWRNMVEQRALQAIKTAQQNLFPARFAAGEGNVQLGYNRLVRAPDGSFALTHFENDDHIPYGPVDPTVGVIRITDDQDKPRAVLVNYACHPVVLGPRNRKISADYPGVMRREIEAKLGNGVTCFFFQGCCGDINPLLMARGTDRDADFEVVARVGHDLADEVSRVLARIGGAAGRSESLEAMGSQVQVANRWEPSETMTLGVTSLLINRSIGVMTMPGEPFHQFQVDFRAKAGVPHAYVFGYASNGPYPWPSYIPDAPSAARGGYGASDTTSAEVGAGEWLLYRGLAQLYQLQGRLKAKPQRHTNK